MFPPASQAGGTRRMISCPIMERLASARRSSLFPARPDKRGARREPASWIHDVNDLPPRWAAPGLFRHGQRRFSGTCCPASFGRSGAKLQWIDPGPERDFSACSEPRRKARRALLPTEQAAGKIKKAGAYPGKRQRDALTNFWGVWMFYRVFQVRLKLDSTDMSRRKSKSQTQSKSGLTGNPWQISFRP